MNIKDIAALAHVGVSTVSRVLNNHPDVKEETRQRILEIIKENNYIPNNSARILKQSNTKNIGILVKGVTNPFFSEILKYINVEIQKAGYTVILQHYNNRGSDVGTLLGFIKEKRLQGVICLGGNFDEMTDEDLGEVESPIILISVSYHKHAKQKLKKCSTISIDNQKGGYIATEYLINKGHQQIGLLLGEEKDFNIGGERYKGYMLALKEAKLKANEEYVIYGEYECKKAYEETKKLLEKHPEITAIFAISDIMATGAAKASYDLGKKVGRDISIMGFDGMDIAAFYEPSLATIKQPKEEMGKKSVELLFKLLAGKIRNKHIILDVELIEGQSVRSLVR